MDGYNNQWSGYGYGNSNGFYEQLQQYATPQQQPMTYPQMQQQNSQNHHLNSQPQTIPYVEVVVPARPNQPQYQPPGFHQQYAYNQHIPAPDAINYQQTYQQLPQLDGAANSRPPLAVQQPHRPMQNGAPLQNGSSTTHTTRSIPMQSQPPTPSTPRPRHEYAQVLLVLAEEYIEASTRVEQDSEEHFKLMSFALGCLESVLKNFQLPPLREAQISLTYAQLLYEKTENYDEAEKALTKALELCEGNNLLDLKYSVMLLSAKILFQTKWKAAIKAMQGSIADMATYNHVAWEYAFRYELAVLYLAAPIPDLHSAIVELGKVESLATNNGDKMMCAFAAATTGLLHLRTCHADSVSEAQQVVARLRSLQADSSVEVPPPIEIAVELIDLSCSIRRCAYIEGNQKRKRLHELWLECQKDPYWSENGNLLYIAINQSSLRGFVLQQGGVIMQHQGRPVLPAAWFSKEDISVLDLLLGAATKAHTNSSDGGHAAQFLTAGLALLKKAVGPSKVDRNMLECRLLIDAAFVQCMEGKWLAGKQYLQNAAKLNKPHYYQFPPSMHCAVTYLNGCIQQGLGNLDRALEIWNQSSFKLESYLPQSAQEKAKTGRRHQDQDTEVCRNLTILACMNRLFIIDDATHPQHGDKDRALAQLGDFVRCTEDRNISAAQMLVHSLLSQSGIWGTKEGVLKTLSAAKAVANQQIIALVLAVMQQTFFLGLTHESAGKCVNAVAKQARAWRNPTWLHVAQGIEAESLRYMGQFDESAEKLEEAKESWNKLPEGIKKTIDWRSMPATKSVVKQDKK